MTREGLEKLGYKFDIRPSRYRVLFRDPDTLLKSIKHSPPGNIHYRDDVLDGYIYWGNVQTISRPALYDPSEVIFSGRIPVRGQRPLVGRPVTQKAILAECIKAASLHYVKWRLMK